MRAFRTYEIIAAFLILIVFLFFFIVRRVILNERPELHQNKLKNLNSNEIMQISIQFETKKVEFTQAANKDIIYSFCTSISDAETWVLNRPQKSIIANIICTDGSQFNLRIYFDRGQKTVNFVSYRILGNFTIPIVNLKSAGLYRWFEEQRIVKKLQTSEYKHRSSLEG